MIDAKDDDLWERLTALPRPYKVVDYPKNDAEGKPIGQLAIWVLTQAEQEAAATAAGVRARKALADPTGNPIADAATRQAFDDLYANSSAVELLFRCCRKATNINQPAFPSPEALRLKLSVDEVSALCLHYYTVQADLGPIVATMSMKEVDAWIERLAKSGERYPLDLLSPESLKTLAFSLALRLAPSSTDTSSAGVPLESEPTSGPSDKQADETGDAADESHGTAPES